MKQTLSISLAKPKVLFVLGSTGSGKTKLAVEIALALGENGDSGAEIVNCDSIQMYKGLDVASAKATIAERRGIPHHLLSFLQPRDNFNVRDYRIIAGKAIEDIVSRGKMAIVTGGTLYYAQALMREGGLLNELDELQFASTENVMTASETIISSTSSLNLGSTSSTEANQGLTTSSKVQDESRTKNEVENITDSKDKELNDRDGLESNYIRLQRVDPIMARRLHPHDKRKIARALQVYDTTGGVPYSTVLSLQAKRIDGSTGPYNCKIICLVVNDRLVHNERLDRRAKDMLSKGLIREQRVLRDYLAGKSTNLLSELSQDTPSELTDRIVKEMVKMSSTGDISSSSIEERSEHAGLLQAIGYKEFAEYLDLFDESQSELQSQSHLINFEEKSTHVNMVDKKEKEEEKSEFEGSKKRKRTSVSCKSLSVRIAESLQVAERRLCDVTHQYARKQERWLRNRFANRGVTMTMIDTSCVSQKLTLSNSGEQVDTSNTLWEKHVLTPAINDVRSWIAINEVPAASESSRIEAWNQYICEVCNGKLLNGELAWKEHVQSKPHLKSLRNEQRKKEKEKESGFIV